MRTVARGHGVAVRDYDRDGWPDVFVASSNGPAALFRNRGDGTFEDVTGRSGIQVDGVYYAPAWADIDNDGWADLAVVGLGGQTRLLRARGDGTFEDISAGSGIDLDAPAASLAFGDYDADGLLDLFTAVEGAADRLYRNLGSGVFEDVTTRGGVAGPDYAVAMQATWFDYDHNGSQDLFVVHDGFLDSRLHRNLGYLPLIDQARTAGFHDVGSGNSMGMAWADVDGDGWEDVYVTRIGEAGLYLNQQGRGFVMAEDALGAWRNGMAWGTVFADFDNDLDPDLFVVNTSGYDGTRTLLYENRGTWFYDRSQSAGASLYSETQGLASFDYNLDGHVDLVFPDHDGRVRVLKGVPENPGHWLRLQLEGAAANRDAIGARVEAWVGNRVVTRWVSGGDSFCSQSEPVLHFGLGEAAAVDRLVVHWGGTAGAEEYGTLAAGTHHLRQGSGSPAGTRTESPEIPATEARLQAFPNPVSADTRFRIDLSRPGTVRITLWDVQGRQLGSIPEQRLPAGTSYLDLGGATLPSGITFVRMETETGLATTALLNIRSHASR